jgi:hypothetical protein
MRRAHARCPPRPRAVNLRHDRTARKPRPRTVSNEPRPAMTRMPRRRTPPRSSAPLPAWALPALALLLALPAGCSSHHIDPDQPQDAAIREFQATHTECNPNFFRRPCQIGPDGKLYRFNPGEHDRPHGQ